MEEVKNLSVDLYKQMFLHLWKQQGCPLKNEDFLSESSLENIADIANVAAMHFSIGWDDFSERVNEIHTVMECDDFPEKANEIIGGAE